MVTHHCGTCDADSILAAGRVFSLLYLADLSEAQYWEASKANDVVFTHASPQNRLSKMPVWSTGAQAVRSCILPHKQLELAVTTVVD
jgi:hypothetical protein